MSDRPDEFTSMHQRNRELLERFGGALGGESTRQMMERVQRQLENGGLIETLRKAQAALDNNATSALIRQYQDSMANSNMNRLLEQHRNMLADHSLTQMLDRFRENLDRNGSVVGRLPASLDPYRDQLAAASSVRDLAQRLSLQGIESKRQAVEAISQELLARLNEKPKTVSLEGHASISIGVYFDLQVSERSPAQAGDTAITEKADWSGWPTVFLFFLMSALCQTLINWEAARQGLVDANARLPRTEFLSDVREFIRIELAGKPGDYRLVSGSGVALRAGPGTKSEVILRLPYQAVVVVLEKEDRTWRYVSYVHEGYVIDGYVSSKYLKQVRR